MAVGYDQSVIADKKAGTKAGNRFNINGAHIGPLNHIFWLFCCQQLFFQIVFLRGTVTGLPLLLNTLFDFFRIDDFFHISTGDLNHTTIPLIGNSCPFFNHHGAAYNLAVF